MSLIKVKDPSMHPGPYYAVQVGTRRDGPFDDPFWMVYFSGPKGRGYPYEDYEVERVPAHRGKYDASHWGEIYPAFYRLILRSRHRREEN